MPPAEEFLTDWPLYLAHLPLAAAAVYFMARLLPGSRELASERFTARLRSGRRERGAPPGTIDVFACLIAFYFWLAFFQVVVVQSGLGERLYGREMMDALRSDAPDRTAGLRVGLLAAVLAFPFQVASILWVVRRLSDTRSYQLGLTTRRLGRNTLLGVLAWFAVTLPLLGFFLLVTQGFKALSESSAAKHSFELLYTQNVLSKAEVGVLVFLAVVAAPVAEELLFRGLIQRWASLRAWAPHAVMGVAAVLSLPALAGLSGSKTFAERLAVVAPLLFVVLLLPVYYLVIARSRTPRPAAIFATSLLFAMIHSAWPSPVALFLLALVLGWLTDRTRSLVPAVVTHSLFNGVACVQMFLE
jgi:membrane protease YdiL (CAAX protease family)